jgi:N-methylhydantoinase A
MGGTSFDVGIIVDGKPLISATHEVGGYHLNKPRIDIRAIGAGGGSIARVENGLLRVGPESAGANPGPVCYGRGGTRVTVTDADVALGIISPDNFLGGRMLADRDAALTAIRDQIAEPLGLTIEKAALGIKSVVDAHMSDTLREVTIGRGYDPRDFVLFAYGGAGPVHCAAFAADLGVSRIVIPATSMAHSAYGALASDIHQSAERSLVMRGGGGAADPWQGLDPETIGAIFAELEIACIDRLEAAGVARSKAEIVRTIDMRYRRQTHDLIIRFAAGPISMETVIAAVNIFEQTYEALYGKGSGFRQAGIELTTFRVEGIGRTPKPVPSHPAAGKMPRASKRSVYDASAERWADTAIWQWLELPVGEHISGPAVIEHPETTVYIAAKQAAVVDGSGNLVISLGGTGS